MCLTFRDYDLQMQKYLKICTGKESGVSSFGYLFVFSWVFHHLLIWCENVRKSCLHLTKRPLVTPGLVTGGHHQLVRSDQSNQEDNEERPSAENNNPCNITTLYQDPRVLILLR